MSFEEDSMSSDAVHALDGYGDISLPDLSHVRNPSPGFALIESEVHPACTESHVVAALARCLGAYCAANDILLGWHTNHEHSGVRVRWQSTTTWNQVIHDLSPFPISVNEIHATTEIQKKQSPFIAIVASESEANVDHPLVAAFSGSRVSMKFSTKTFHVSAAQILLSQVKEVISRAIEEPDQSISLSFLSGILLSRVDLTPEVEPYTHIPNVEFVTDFLPLHDPEIVVIEYHPDLSLTDRAAQTLSFGELRCLSNQFAHYLLNLGLKLEDKVAVSLPKCADLYIAIMGIWKAGGCYVPIDPDLPLERREFIAKDSNARFLINIDNVHDHLENIAQHSTDDINVTHSDAPSYMLYTSGTTGTPKGCLLTQKGLTQAIMGLSFDAKFPDCANPRFLAVAAIAFDVHISEFLLPCALGMTHVVVPRSQVLEDLALWTRKLRITHFGSVPSLIEATLVNIDDADSYLRYISCGGEKMTDVILNRWGGHPVVKLMNYYGPSEVTIGCSSMRMLSNTRRESIGRIFNNSSAYVMDENLELVVRGAAGELLVGGPLVGRGYHNRDDLTKKAFVIWEGQKLYRTGDLVRLMPDDTMEMLGRIDTQIKLRGVRIEVEGVSTVVRTAAMRTPGLSLKTKIDVCTILGRHPSIQSDQLVSFVTWTTGASISERRSRQPRVLQESPKGMLSAIREACKAELASYMCPAHIIFVEFLPLNSNGKTDAKVLTSIFTSLGLDALSTHSAPPNGASTRSELLPSRPPTQMENEVINIVSDLSSIPQSSINLSNNLFELGFDSLKFIRLTAVLRSNFSLTSQQWSVTEVMSCESILQLCSAISSRVVADLKLEHASSNADAFIAQFGMRMKPQILDSYKSDSVEAVYPTFPLQDGVLYRSSSDDALYIQHVIMKLGSGISESRLKGAWAMMQHRHEILRTVFHFSNAIAQVVLKTEHCLLPWHTVLENSAVDSGSFSTKFYDDYSRATETDINANISTNPPFRLLLLKDATTTHLVLSIHHAIFDARSLDLLFAEVEGVYHEQALETTAPLSESLRCIYATDIQKAEEFWKAAFGGFIWPRMTPVASASEKLATLDITLNTSYEQLLARASKARATLSVLCTVAFAVCLARHVYASSDVVFGSIWSGRSYADKRFDDAQCPLLAVIPTRVQLNEGTSAIRNLQRHAGEALAYSHIPLGRMQQWLRSGNPIFDILFSTTLDDNSTPTLWDVVSSSQPAADFPLAVEVGHHKNANDVWISAAFTSVFKESVIRKILRDFEGFVISLSGDSSSNLLESFGPSLGSTSPTDLVSYDEDDDSEETYMVGNDGIEELESKLRGIVSRFLEVSSDNLNAKSSLFSFGLDSIKSIGLSRALKAEGLKISAVSLMQHSSIRRLARFLRSSLAETSISEGTYSTDASEILESSRREIAAYVNVHELQLRHDDSIELFPTTDLQSGMLSQTVNSSENLYIHDFVFKLDSAVDVGHLRDAWIKTLEECAILRTSFHFLVEAGTWIQAVHSVVDLNWHDLREPSLKSVAEGVQEFIRVQKFTEEAALYRPPVHFLVCYDEASARPSHLALILHHALYDGVSIPILKKRVEDLYEQGFQHGTPVIQFHDLLGQILYQEIHGTGFWMNYVSGCSTQIWPRIHAGEHDGAHAIQLTATIPIPTSKLKDAISHYGVTMQCLGQAAMAEGLANIYRSREVVFGHVLSGRNLYGSEDVVGPMITSVPCRVKLGTTLKVDLGVIRSIHRHNVEAGSWQHISLRKIQHGLGRRSLWDSLFVFQSSEDVNSSGAQAMVFDESVEEALRLQYALNVELHQTNDGFVLRAACQGNALSSNGLKDFVNNFSRRLLEIIESPLSDRVNGHVVTQAASEQSGQDLSGGHILSSSLALDEYPKHADFLRILSQSVNVPISSMRADMPLASMGVDSISSIQIAAKCRSSGFLIRAPQILKCERLSELLDSISETKANNGFSTRDETHTAMNGLQVRTRSGSAIETILPASPGMTWLVAMWQTSRRAQFHYCFAYRLTKSTSIPRLQRAWIQLVKIHPILRSTFNTMDGCHLQVMTFRGLPSEQIWSLIRLEGERKEIDTVQDLTEAIVSKPLSTQLSPMRAILAQGNESAYLILHLHHFHYDAWSLKILVNHLSALYNDVQSISPQVDDLGKFLRYCQPSDAQKSEQREFWQTHLKVPFVPSLLPKKLATREGGKRTVLFSRAAIKNVEVLREKARQLSVSLSAVLITCWAHVQAKLCNMEGVTFGLWQSGRSSDLVGIESMAIPCMNVLPIRIDSAYTLSEKSCRSINSHLRQRSGIVEQTFLDDIRNWTKLDQGPMFNVCLNILDSRVGADANGTKSELLEPLNVPYYIPEIPDYDEVSGPKTLSTCHLVRDSLMAEIIVRDNVMDVSIEYGPGYLDDISAQSLVEDWSRALGDILRLS